jgi:hypothetical protein
MHMPLEGKYEQQVQQRRTEEQRHEPGTQDYFVDGIHSIHCVCGIQAIEGTHDEIGQGEIDAGHQASADRRV